MTHLVLDSAAYATMVEHAIAGDEAAFARIVAAYHLDLVRVAFVICGDQGRAEDAAQSAWWIAWRKLPSLRDNDRLRPWLVSIAANEARKIVKHERGRRVPEIAIDLDRSSSIDPEGAIDGVDLRNALARLAPQDRALIALRYAAGLDASELAPYVGLSPSGVRTRLSRLLDRLRGELNDD
jgi:RNA polymerase sigma factor (sigma-70 family)